MKKFLKAVGILLGAVLVLLVGYLIYLFASYHRIPDNQELKVETSAAQTSNPSSLHTDTEYSALTYNIGFGAYTPDFSFFMDGGKSSWAKNKDSLLDAVQGAGVLAASGVGDFSVG